ncbi:MAG: carboxypeptidase-like regulatory domain-containing protein [Candidatus Cloacimonadota bacterium]|nr:carboxypeptidase-like regulatory domain-containing protein [Candidatus Cloacimonadota bacterium]
MKIFLLVLFIYSVTLILAVDIWEDGFEELTGWVLNGEFEIDSPQGLGGEYGNPDPTSAYAGSNVLGVDLTGLGASLGDYESDLGAHEYFAISPAIDCSEFVGVELNFMKWLNVEQPAYDHAYISVSNDDGTTWIDIWTNSSVVTNNSWSISNYDISEIADLNSEVRIRFSIGTTDGSWQYSGWNIDDLTITGNPVIYGAIEGNVINEDNGEPIAFAPIMNQYGNTMSDGEGYFILNNIPTGNQEITINALGYIPFLQINIIITEDDTTYVLCELEPDPNTPPPPQNPQASVYDGNNVHLTWEEPDLPDEELLAYNVYRNGIIVQSVIAEEYFDLNLINGDYSYFISAVYDSGESLPTDTVNVQINVVGLEDDVIPNSNYDLSNYPNPFNPETTIYFETTSLRNASARQANLHENSRIEIYNLKGQKIKSIPVILSDAQHCIEGSVIWNGTNQNNQPVSSGIYFYQLEIDGKIAAKSKMMLLK